MIKKIAEFPWCALYARRTEPGGLEYFTDDVGGGQRVLDTTTVDLDVVRFIVDNHYRIEAIFDKLPYGEQNGS